MSAAGTLWRVPRRSAAETVWLVVDAAVALTAVGARRGSRGAVAVARALRPLTNLAMRPPLVPQRYWPERQLIELAALGRDRRHSAIAVVRQRCRQLVPAVATEILDQLELTALIQERVDLDALLRGIDLPAIIRESTGSLTSDAMRGNRIQSSEADQAVAAWVDRVFGPHSARQGDTEE